MSASSRCRRHCGGYAQSSSENVKLHNVHIYAIVRVKVSNVEAENHAEAIKKAEDMIDLNGLFNRGSDQEFADDIDCFLVDEVGEEEFHIVAGIRRMAFLLHISMRNQVFHGLCVKLWSKQEPHYLMFFLLLRKA